MILSMTGYGSGTVEKADLSVTVEIRGVNNRYLKTSYRTAEYLAALEPEFDRVLRKRVSRGALTVTVRTVLHGIAAHPPISEEVVAGYVAELKRLAERHSLPFDLGISTLMTLPGVFNEETMATELDPIRDGVLEAFTAAVADFQTMRQREGETLAADLREQSVLIRDRVARCRELAPTAVTEFRDRLMNRIAELLQGSSIDLVREALLGEVSVYAERSDINEEISRLMSHLDQFDELLEVKEPVGRKLEFLSQEMLREANTMGSKSGHPEIGRHVVDMKAAIDRIKEQVQNAE